MELFKFEPLLKQTILGGSKLLTFKHLQSDLVNVGESQLEAYDPKLDLENYHYPTLDLLKK